MASKRLSPAANLLRHSKLFSLPPPLRRPPPENPGSRNETFSETATLPYPTHAAVETTPRALRIGEWGLKRALPGRAGRTSTPVLRINAVDNADHITDYDSAADHVLTLEKWQEMDIALTASKMQGEQLAGTARDRGPPSVFEDSMHDTEAKSEEDRASKQRWKFDGPWIIGMTPLEFEEYLDRKLTQRRAEFLAHLRTHLTQKKARAARSLALARGRAPPPAAATLSDAEFRENVKRLKTQRVELFELIWKFLDIPGPPPLLEAGDAARFRERTDYLLSDEDEQSPAQTHPSVGLAYARTGAHLYNHPTLGPQRIRPPVRGRIVTHANRARAGAGTKSLVGVGGVVGSFVTESLGFDDTRHRGEQRFDADVTGGSKAWVLPQHAVVDPSGRVRLQVEKAASSEVAIWEHELPPGTEFEAANPLRSLAGAERADRAARPRQFAAFENAFRSRERPL